MLNRLEFTDRLWPSGFSIENGITGVGVTDHSIHPLPFSYACSRNASFAQSPRSGSRRKIPPPPRAFPRRRSSLLPSVRSALTRRPSTSIRPGSRMPEEHHLRQQAERRQQTAVRLAHQRRLRFAFGSLQAAAAHVIRHRFHPVSPPTGNPQNAAVIMTAPIRPSDPARTAAKEARLLICRRSCRCRPSSPARQAPPAPPRAPSCR